MAEERVTYEPEEFPLYYQAAEQLKLGGIPSGKVGAEAQLLFTVNNYPQIFYGLRIRNSWSVPDTVWNAAISGALQIQQLHQLDGEQVVRIDLAQQNIITRPIHQETLQGGPGPSGAPVNWHPFPVPFFFRGGNEVRVTIVRIQPYPTLTIGEETVDIFPTIHATLVAGVLVSDLLPAAGPPSTGADDWRRRG